MEKLLLSVRAVLLPWVLDRSPHRLFFSLSISVSMTLHPGVDTAQGLLKFGFMAAEANKIPSPLLWDLL